MILGLENLRNHPLGKNIKFEVYALLILSKTDNFKIRDFLKEQLIEERFIENYMHLTVYYARRLIKNLTVMEENCNGIIRTRQTNTVFI